MVKYSETQLNLTFMALADDTRRALLARLAQGDALVSELAEPFDMSLPAISKHLGILERADLIRREKHGRLRRCILQPQALQQASDWIEFYREFWQGSLDSLDGYLQRITTTQEEKKS